jgi:hypothetical protein
MMTLPLFIYVIVAIQAWILGQWTGYQLFRLLTGSWAEPYPDLVEPVRQEGARPTIRQSERCTPLSPDCR